MVSGGGQVKPGDPSGPCVVRQLGSELNSPEYLPDTEELHGLIKRLSAELDKLG